MLESRAVLAASAALVCLLAVILGNTISSRHTPTTIASDVPGADSKSAPWYIHHAKWLASNAAAVSTMQTSLEADRSAISNDTTLQHTTAAFGGSKLPKKVKLQQAQQLLIDRQLLAHSLARDGFAAARAAALRQHYKQLQTVAADTAAEESIMSELQQQQQQGSQPFGVASRGILVVGGSRTHLGNAYILLRMLREHLHCQLPVEVVYYGPQELDPAAASLIRGLAASQAAAGAAPITLIDGLAVHRQYLQPLLPHPEVPLTSWVAKVHALCWVTSFQQVLLLDSDNLPTQDPSLLFQDPSFIAHGFMTWPDFWHNLWMEPVLYRMLNHTVPWEVNPQGLAAESGQLLIDRARHADVLEWLWMLNAHAGIVYRCVVGDKDTYRMAFELAGKAGDYVQVPHPPRQLLLDVGPTKQRNRFIHLGMGQASPDGSALLFMHRTARGKFFPWCAASRQLMQGTGGCQPTWLTMPVVQEQLMRSVPDPGSMRFDAGKLDTEWYKHACVVQQQNGLTGLRGAGGVDSSGVESESKLDSVGVDAAGRGAWLLQLPVCNYSQEQLPIPVIPVGSVAGLTEFMAVVNGVFAEAAGVLSTPWIDRWKVFWGIL